MMDIMSPKIIQSNFILINRAITFCEEGFLSIFRWGFNGYGRRWHPNGVTFMKGGHRLCAWAAGVGVASA